MTSDNTPAQEIAAWCGGRVLKNDIVVLLQEGRSIFARPGDILHRDSHGKFTVERWPQEPA
jgi:hypothetical protein